MLCIIFCFFLLGVNCPRASRIDAKLGNLEGQPFGDEALQFTKELCLQHEVQRVFLSSCLF